MFLNIKNASKALRIGVDGLKIEYSGTNADGNSALFVANDGKQLMISIFLERAPDAKEAIGYRARYRARLSQSTTPPVGAVIEGGSKERPTIEFSSKHEDVAKPDDLEQQHLNLYLWESGVGASINIRQVGAAPLDSKARRLADGIAFVETPAK